MWVTDCKYFHTSTSAYIVTFFKSNCKYFLQSKRISLLDLSFFVGFYLYVVSVTTAVGCDIGKSGNSKKPEQISEEASWQGGILQYP